MIKIQRIKPKWIVVALVVLALLGGVWRAMSAKQAQRDASTSTNSLQTQIELTAADVIAADLREITQSLNISGTVKALNFAVIKARVAGEIKDITVREGDSVKAGQVLARIDPTEYQRRWQQAQEQAQAAKSQMEIAQRLLDSNKALVDQGFISKTAMDNSLASHQGALATHKAAIAGADVARKSLDDATLRAPFAGVIALRSAQLGERVGVDTKILDLVDLTKLEVESPLSPSESIDVRVGQTASLQLEDRKNWVTAKVTRIAPSAQTGSRSVMIYLALDKPEGLRHGLFAKGVLSMGSAQVIAVPYSAIRSDKAKPYVQTIEKLGDQLQVVHKTVEVGIKGLDVNQPESEPWVGITGLSAGSSVLLARVGALREGMMVKFTAVSKP